MLPLKVSGFAARCTSQDSGFTVYVGEKIVLKLRESQKQPEDNGSGSSFLRPLISPTREFAKISRHLNLLGGKIAYLRPIPADSAIFESETLHACELVLKHDVRFGRIPQSRQTRPAKQHRK